MLDLEITFPWVHAKFKGEFYTVRHSERFWAGLWTNLTIKQVMMRSIKSRGGLTRGRGITESVRTLWINTVQACGDCRSVSCHNGRTEIETIDDDDLHEYGDGNVFEKLFDGFESRRLNFIFYIYIL